MRTAAHCAEITHFASFPCFFCPKTHYVIYSGMKMCIINLSNRLQPSATKKDLI